MMKYWFMVILLHKAILGQHGVIGAPDNKGSEYIIGYMENVGFGGSSPLNPELYVTTMRTTTVNVRVKAPLYTRFTIDESFTVTAGVIKKLTFDSDIRVTGDVLTNKGIWVIADDEIVIYGVSPETYSNDAFLGLPTDVMGKEYYVVTWWPPEFQCELMVVGINDSTTVNVRLSDALGSSTVTYNGVNYVKGDTITITLNRYQTLQLTSDGDLTGTYITSDKIVSVFSGNKKTKVDSGTSSDHLVEQWPPVFAYGKRFVTVPIPERTTGDKFKFVASENDTHVTITGNSYSDSFTLSEPGSHAEKDIPSGTNYYCYVQSDKPILVAQFCKSQASKSEKADPMMAFIPPIEQYTADYTFATPQYSGSGSYTNYFMFIVKDAQKSGLRVDGSAFPGSTVYTPVPGTDLVAGFIQVSDGTHTIRHTSPISVFGGYLYGTANYESYGFPTGTRVAPINAPCSTSTTEIGDGLDNDCDGLIDEELCPDGNDDDGDGSTDEDCAMPFPIDGNWTDWTAWACTVTCSISGGLEHGTISRTRTCTNPPPQYDGQQCVGISNETQTTCSTLATCQETTTEAVTTTTESTTTEVTTTESITELETTTESTTEPETTTTVDTTTESATTADSSTSLDTTEVMAATLSVSTRPTTKSSLTQASSLSQEFWWSNTPILAGIIGAGVLAATCMSISLAVGLRKKWNIKSKKVEPKEAFRHDFDVKNYDMRWI